MHRDLLRSLLLKGGTALGDVIFNALTNKESRPDMTALYRTLKERGLLTQTDDRLAGYSTFTVNESLTDVLKGLLFPRQEENDTPFFSGIPVPKRS